MLLCTRPPGILYCLGQPVEGVVGIIDDVAIAVGMAGQVAVAVVAVALGYEQSVLARDGSVAAVVGVSRDVGVGVSQAQQVLCRIVSKLGHSVVRVADLRDVIQIVIG